MKIVDIEAQDSLEYDDFLKSVSSSMLYQSSVYRDFLTHALPNANSHYLGAFKSGKLVGALPLMSADGPAGRVFNSLPFFGSHGGLLLLPNSDSDVAGKLIEAAKSLCRVSNAFSMTIVESPIGDSSNSKFGLRKTDERIGQITVLPTAARGQNVEEALMSRFHGKTRNAIRKAQKSGFEVVVDNSRTGFENLWDLHRENMAVLGGNPKSDSVMSAIQACFRPDHDFQVYAAKDGAETAASLLVLFYRDFVEYWIPATRDNYRANQPLSLLIFEAMKDAVLRRQSRYWNWGGTWHTQQGVYNFKSRWGTRDFRYSYSTTLLESSYDFRGDAEELIAAYPGFYLAPLDELRS